MKTRILGAALASLLLLPGVSAAQKLGSAMGAPPFRTTKPAPPAREPAPPGEDLFRAHPRTYQPRYDRVRHGHFPRHLFFPGNPGFFGPVYAPSWPWPASGEPRDRTAGREEPVSTVYIRPETPPAPPVPYAPGSPGPPKTLYVIRGCYAGDVPPRPEQLPDGCDAAGIVAIPPRER